jgi:hypothetical protein
MRIQPITSIDELLKHDRPYPRFAPVILCDRSLWEKAMGWLKGWRS